MVEGPGVCIGTGVGPPMNAGVAAVAGVGANEGVGALCTPDKLPFPNQKISELTQGVVSDFHPLFRVGCHSSFASQAVFVPIRPGVAPPQAEPLPVGATFLPGVAPPQVLEPPPPLA